jgi:hypothetical protein
MSDSERFRVPPPGLVRGCMTAPSQLPNRMLPVADYWGVLRCHL